MNKVQLVGRFTKDPDVRYTDGGTSISRFTIAVDRRFKKEGEQQTADFISCVSFGKTAEFVEKYFKKDKESAYADAFRQEVIQIMMVKKSIQQMLLRKKLSL